jgi:hypothetical protein
MPSAIEPSNEVPKFKALARAAIAAFPNEVVNELVHASTMISPRVVGEAADPMRAATA